MYIDVWMDVKVSIYQIVLVTHTLMVAFVNMSCYCYTVRGKSDPAMFCSVGSRFCKTRLGQQLVRFMYKWSPVVAPAVKWRVQIYGHVEGLIWGNLSAIAMPRFTTSTRIHGTLSLCAYTKTVRFRVSVPMWFKGPLIITKSAS